jgi:hypothetical protein
MMIMTVCHALAGTSTFAAADRQQSLTLPVLPEV